MASIVGVILVQFLICYLRYRRKKSDEIWQVNHEELHFSHPVEIIGQGAFGVVLLAEYRGTKVAIKRVLPKQRKKSRSGSMSMEKKQESVQSNDNDVEKDMYSPNGSVDDSLGMRCGSFQPSTTGSRRTSSHELDFLGGLSVGNKRTLLCRWFPFLFPDEIARYNMSVLGTVSGGSNATRSLLWRCVPRCDEDSRRQNEFIAEMRLLSRLRHPCK